MNNSDSKQTDLDDNNAYKFAELECEPNELKEQSMLLGYIFLGVIILLVICTYCYLTF